MLLLSQLSLGMLCFYRGASIIWLLLVSVAASTVVLALNGSLLTPSRWGSSLRVAFARPETVRTHLHVERAHGGQLHLDLVGPVLLVDAGDLITSLWVSRSHRSRAVWLRHNSSGYVWMTGALPWTIAVASMLVGAAMVAIGYP